jgi:hypothetical protein
MQNGIVDLTLGENGKDVQYIADSDSFLIPSTVLSTWTRKLSEIASNPRSALSSASEVGSNGKVVRSGMKLQWEAADGKMMSYSSDSTDPEVAANEIMKAMIGKADKSSMKKWMEILMDEPASVLVKTGDGSKNLWIETFMPKPVEPDKLPDKPSEEVPDEKAVMAQAGDVAGTGEAPEVVETESVEVESVIEVPVLEAAQPVVAPAKKGHIKK